MTAIPAASVSANASSDPTIPWSRPPLESTSVPSAISPLPPASRPEPGRRERAKRTADHAAPPNTTSAPGPLPAPASARGEGRRREGEEHECDRPGTLVGGPGPRPAHGCRLGEQRGDRGCDEGETGDHGRLERTSESLPSTL